MLSNIRFLTKYFNYFWSGACVCCYVDCHRLSWLAYIKYSKVIVGLLHIKDIYIGGGWVCVCLRPEIYATEWGSLAVWNGSCHDSRFSPAGRHFLIRRGAENDDLASVPADSGKSHLKKKTTLLSLQWVVNKSGQHVAKVTESSFHCLSSKLILCFAIRFWASLISNIVLNFSCR